MRKIYSKNYTVKGRTFEIAAFADQNKVVYKIFEGSVVIPQFELTMTVGTAQDYAIHSPFGQEEIVALAIQYLDENA
jgi:hypothetical protein